MKGLEAFEDIKKVMNKILDLREKLSNLYKEKHKRDDIFRAFGLSQCHQLDWEINHTIELLNEVLL